MNEEEAFDPRMRRSVAQLKADGFAWCPPHLRGRLQRENIEEHYGSGSNNHDVYFPRWAVLVVECMDPMSMEEPRPRLGHVREEDPRALKLLRDMLTYGKQSTTHAAELEALCDLAPPPMLRPTLAKYVGWTLAEYASIYQ